MSGYDIQQERKGFLEKYHTDFMGVCGAADRPKSMDPRKWYKIENQFNFSSCVGNGETGVLELSYRNAMGGVVGQFSRWHAYLLAQKESDAVCPGYRYFGRDGGALIEGAVKAATTDGCALESTFPYPKYGSGYNTTIPKAATEEAQKFKIRSSAWMSSYEDTLAYLGTGQGGILIGAPWPFDLSSGYTMDSFRNYGNAGHAWCILGYLEDGRLVAANSHDITYADKGFFYITKRGYTEFVNNPNVSAAGLSDLTTPRPRSVDWSQESMFL